MDDIFVARLMSTDPRVVTRDTLVEDAGELMLDHDIGSVMIVDDDNQLEGILTTTDFVAIVAESQPKAETTVARYMTTDVITASAQDSIVDAADMMVTYGVHHLPVVDDDAGVIGMIATSDLTTYLSQVSEPTPQAT